MKPPKADASYPDMNAIRERANLALYKPITRAPLEFAGIGYRVEIDFLGEVFTYFEEGRSAEGFCGRRYGFTVEPQSLRVWLPANTPISDAERALIVQRVRQATGVRDNRRGAPRTKKS